MNWNWWCRNVEKIEPACYCCMMKRLEKENIVMEPIATYENTDLLKDVHSLTTIQYLAELNGINSILSSLENVTRFSLQQFKNCYSTFIECNATKEQLDKLISKAKEYYEGIEEYIQCLGYFYVF